MYSLEICTHVIVGGLFQKLPVSAFGPTPQPLQMTVICSQISEMAVVGCPSG